MGMFKKILFFTLLLFTVTSCYCSIPITTDILHKKPTYTARVQYGIFGSKVSQMPIFRHLTSEAEKEVYHSFIQKSPNELCDDFVSTCCEFTPHTTKDNIIPEISEIAKNPIGKELLCTIQTKYATNLALIPILFEESSRYMNTLAIFKKSTENLVLRAEVSQFIRDIKVNPYSFSRLDTGCPLVITYPSKDREDITLLYWAKSHSNKPSIKQLPFPSDTSIVHELIHALHCIEDSMYESASHNVIESRIFLGKNRRHLYFNAYKGIAISPVRYAELFIDSFADDEEYRTMYGIMDHNTYDRLNETAYNVVKGTPLVRVSHGDTSSLVSSLVSINPMHIPMDRAMVEYHLGIE